ncbi:hypothetical protein [Micromonospora sp. WMMD714]|uniref:hypothetical protein n=1 Tax=Micromonospora sp. WMMD714 TaxID=3016097 RepID=UPI00249A25D8|nr:hypothetical protein [Micromonospora sp. WMMD714]WFE62626.1 hypothetical protein O7625_04680 [Micromonospora sp. WMMD714]
MPPRPHRPAALAWQVFRGSDAIRQGLLTRHHLRGASWLRLGHDVYADARLDRDHALTCRAALLRMPAGTVIAGPSAAYLHGVEHAAGFRDEVHVLVPRAARVGSQGVVPSAPPGSTRRAPTSGAWPGAGAAWPGAGAARLTSTGGVRGGAGGGWSGSPGGIRVHTTAATGGPSGFPLSGWAYAPGQAGPPPPPGSASHPATSPLVLAGNTSGTAPIHLAHATPPGLAEAAVPGPSSTPRSSPALAAWETAAWLEPVRAVGIVDSLLGSGLTSPAALSEIARRFADRRGGRRARRVFDLADPAAQSPPESHLRVRLVLAGLPRPVAQHPARLPSGLFLHPDLAWPEFRVAMEYDGHWHTDPDQLHRDRRRLNQLVAAGWIVLHVTSRRLTDDFPGVVREVRTVLAQRGWRR